MLQASKLLKSVKGPVPTGSRVVPLRATAQATAQAEYVLVDSPVSNNGARVRFVIYSKGLENITRVPPNHFGDLKSEAYLKLNPQGKFPLLMLPNGQPLPESEVIVQYLLQKYSHVGPSLTASTPEQQAVANLVTRIHDVYIVPIQACMYRAMPSAEQRAKDIAQIAYQLEAIEKAMVGGPFIAGSEITTADGALFPTVVFMNYILPKFFGWESIFTGRPKLQAWWDAMREVPEGRKIYSEVQGGLEGWDNSGRWQNLGIIEQIASNPQCKWSY